MSAKKTVTALLVMGVFTLLAVLAFHVRIAATADSVAVLRTTGMTCGSCSSKITRTLEAVHGVAVTEVDLEGGWVAVGYDTKLVKPEVLADKVRGVGFGSNVQVVLTPEQFKQITGREVGKGASSAGGCGGCGKGGGCGAKKRS